LGSVLLILLQGDFIRGWGPGLFEINLVTLVTAWLLLVYGDLGAVSFALGQGLLIDIFSAAPLGLYSGLGVVMYLCIKVGSRFFDLNSIRGEVMIVSISILIKYILLYTFLDLLSYEIILSRSFIASSIFLSLLSGTAAPFLFIILNRIHMRLIEMGISKTDNLEIHES
jgi:hypothetical protein